MCPTYLINYLVPCRHPRACSHSLVSRVDHLIHICTATLSYGPTEEEEEELGRIEIGAVVLSEIHEVHAHTLGTQAAAAANPTFRTIVSLESSSRCLCLRVAPLLHRINTHTAREGPPPPPCQGINRRNQATATPWKETKSELLEHHMLFCSPSRRQLP